MDRGDIETRFVVTPLTSENRRHPTMFGGWGPHLRGLMRDAPGRLWFPVDRGPDANTNREMLYYRQSEMGWSLVASQSHLAGIQQNVASILQQDRHIRSYGISLTTRWIEECSLDTTNPLSRACNAVVISGRPHVVAPGSNYVGAAVSPDGHSRLVWWTTVGQKGGPGSFSYIYNFGGGWNGPVTSSIGRFNDLAYVYARMIDSNRVVWTGQLFEGEYPNGHYQAAVFEAQLGQPIAQLHGLFEASAGSPLKSGADIWVDPATRDVHVIAESSDSRLAYFHRPASASSWNGHTVARHILPGVFRGRFHFNGTTLSLILGLSNANRVRILSADRTLAHGPVDWDAVASQDVTIAGAAFGSPAAIFVEGAQYQGPTAKDLNFAVCGQDPASGNLVYHVWAPTP